MKIGIICAMEEELAPLKKIMSIKETRTKARMEFIEGTLEEKDVVMVISGIGKVNAAVCAQILADDYQVTHLINVGVAGGVKENIQPMDVVVAKALLQHDMDVTAFGLKRGEIPRFESSLFQSDEKLTALALEGSRKNEDYTTHEGIIVSGDQFISSKEKIEDLLETFDAAACEMEGAAIAQAADLNHIPFTVIRAISDNANTGASMDYEKFKDLAVENTVSILTYVLKNL
ncbi:MAG TPA: 5'-methylthioadenosine/adenosylhomocysteine nucleosidase [Proteiniclasticum sp.]|jgi:adenosylhomocysteine nucleosidase|uniref:5'-methylthioadenosine/adenosylhomocysteine nucleosidase n=1 Tax=Proteiniclasticum sp. TaxID=2053595 RepID=UPI000E88E7F6|nr:5'-methylthioadenosine/adenosylhomocysteine nucleosidase [Proteiniclasticum sp.]HBW12306.1 5'-methylthioadenosine/adenosylhomocysteine nucleosidase [Proteiniclasticum sp.]